MTAFYLERSAPPGRLRPAAKSGNAQARLPYPLGRSLSLEKEGLP
jgi:hypothetical protein